MARTFSIQFRHKNHEYTALVSELQDSVSIYFPDQSLHHIVPEGRFSYNVHTGLNFDRNNRSPMQNLILDVLVAIELKQQAYL